MDELREACAVVAARARSVSIVTGSVAAYAATLPARAGSASLPAPPATPAEREARAAYWLTMDAINFGSGWFPTLRKRAGLSGYNTIAAALEDQFRDGAWSAAELTRMTAATLGPALVQDPDHELMALYAASLRDLGEHVSEGYRGRFAAVADAAGGSAVRLARRLGSWASFADCARYGNIELPFLKRAQIAAADLARAGVAEFDDLPRLTMFADNLVPHVLRLDGVLRFDAELVGCIAREELLEHGSEVEVEIRACAVHAVELLVAAAPPPRPTAARVDQILWQRGQQPRYKAVPRHRSRCTAY
ncbi:MAG: queuosine salvage family protein [Solirubrobacteraceae bacterium]